MWLRFIISMRWAEKATSEDDDNVVITGKGIDVLDRYYHP